MNLWPSTITFGPRNNYRTEYVNFEVAEFETSYHAILGRPSLAKFMAIPNHTYLLLKMPAPKGGPLGLWRFADFLCV